MLVHKLRNVVEYLCDIMEEDIRMNVVAIIMYIAS